MNSPGWTALALLIALAPPCRAQVFEAAPDPNAFLLEEHQFNAWAFGNAGSAEAALEHLEAGLDAHVNDIERACDLPPEVREKLELAGRGDIERYFDRIELLRDELQGKSFDRNEISDVYQRFQPLRQKYDRGLFEGDSLLAKIAATALDADQAGRYEEALRRRREFRYRAKVELFIAQMGDSLGLTGEQRDRLVGVVMERTSAPRLFGHQYDQQIVMLKMSRIPEEALRPIVGDARWSVLSQHLQQARGLEPFLKDNGFLDEDDEEQDGD